MKMRNGSPVDLDVENGEVLTVRVTEGVNLQESVNYAWNTSGATALEDTPYAVQYTSQDPDPSALGVRVHFNPDPPAPGGSYTLEVTGSKGGDKSVLPRKREGSLPSQQTGYIIHRAS